MVVPRTGARRRGGRWILALLLLVTVLAVGFAVVHRTSDTASASGSPDTGPPTATPAAGATSTPAAGFAVTAAPTPTPTPSTEEHLRVVGLGDSVTSGEHCDCDDYVSGFGTLLHERDGVRVVTVNDGVSGSTSDDLADDLDADKGVRSDVARADVVVVTMGANDLSPALSRWRAGGCSSGCRTPLVTAMGADLSRVLARVDELTAPGTRVLVTTYWNVFTDGDVAAEQERDGYLAWSDTLTRSANTAICAAAAAHDDTCVDLYTPFKGDGSEDPTTLLADDGDHPDAAGTKLISKAVLAAYEQGR